MKIKHNSCKIFKNILNISKEFLDETVILFSTKGIGIADCDLSKTLFISMAIKKEEFQSYDVSTDVKIAITLSEIYEIFKKSKDEESFSIEINKDTISVQIEGETIRKYQLPLLEMDYKEVKEPNYDFKTSISMPSNILDQIIDNGLILGEELTISIENGKVEFKVEETNKKGLFSIADKMSEKVELVSDEGQITSRYSLEWLDKIVKSIHNLEEPHCKIFLGNDFPIKLVFTKDNFKVSFYLGPRV